MYWLIVKKELREILGTPRFSATFAVVSALIMLAFFLGASDYKAAQAQHSAARTENLRQMEGLTSWLQVSPSVLLPPSPLAALVTGISNDIGRQVNVRGLDAVRASQSRYNEDPILAMFRFLDLEFIFQVVLSLFAILFAFDLVSGEKERGTLRLALSNAVPRDTWILGKLSGAFIALTLPLLVPILAGCLIVSSMGVPLSAGEWGRLALVVAAGLLYVGAFLALSALVSAMTQRTATSFLVLLVCWIMAVLVLPRSAVLAAARSVDVPSYDEILSQQGRLRAQLWREDEQAINDFLNDSFDNRPSSPGSEVGLAGRFNEFFSELNDQRAGKIESLGARLDEDRRNRQATQEALAFGLARLSPAAAFSLACLNLAGTALELPRHFLEQVNAYQEVFQRFQKEKAGVSSSGGIVIQVRSVDDEEPEEKAIDPRELPAFQYRPPSTALLVQRAVFDLGLLALFNVLFFAGSFVAFMRYDVR